MTGVTPNGIRYPDGASKAKNLGPELQQMAEDIDLFIDAHFDPSDPLFKDTAETAVANALASKLGLAKCVHLESGVWVWDGPNGALATHYLLPDDAGALIARATPFPAPSPGAPELNW